MSPRIHYDCPLIEKKKPADRTNSNKNKLPTRTWSHWMQIDLLYAAFWSSKPISQRDILLIVPSDWKAKWLLSLLSLITALQWSTVHTVLQSTKATWDLGTKYKCCFCAHHYGRHFEIMNDYFLNTWFWQGKGGKNIVYWTSFVLINVGAEYGIPCWSSFNKTTHQKVV